MSAALYPSAFAGLQDGTFDWLADEIRVLLMGPAFIPDFSEEFVDSVPANSTIDNGDNLTSRTFVNGLAQSDPSQHLQLFDLKAITSVVLYQDTGDPATSPLIAYYDGENLFGSPLVSEGLDQFVFPDAINGWLIFSESEFVGEINTYELAGDTTLALGEVVGGDTQDASVLFLSGRLVVNTQAVCATPDEPEDCTPPRIRSSIV